MNRRIALLAVLTAAAGITTVLTSAPANAVGITSSNITQPSNGTHYFISDVSPAATVPLVGTTDGAEGTQVDVRCYERTGRWGLIAGDVVLGPGGAISTTMRTDRPYGSCVIRAVPVGYPGGADTTPFTGPTVTGEASYTKPIASGPNAGKVFDFDAWFQGAHAMNEVRSAFGFGLADTRLQVGAVASNYLWTGNASLAYFDGGRSMVRVDGHNAYGPRREWELLPNNPGFRPLTYSATRDAVTGNVTIRETEPIVKCPTDTYPPTAGSCSSWQTAGVRLERTYLVNDGGRQVHVTDVWRSTDGKAHTISAHYDQWIEGADYSSGAQVVTPVGVKLPWRSTSFTTFTSDVVYPGPTAGPRTLFVRDDNGAPDGNSDFPVGAISFDLPPQQVERKENGRFTLRTDGIAVPAGGKRIVREAFVIGTTQSTVAAKAAANEKAINPYRVDALIRAKHATTYTGNNIYNVTGASQGIVLHAHRGATTTCFVQVQNGGTAPDSFTVKGTGGATGFSVRYYAGTTDITAAVKNGTYALTNVAPGAARYLRVAITVKSSALIGALGSWLVTATSRHDGTRKDAVKASVRVVTG
jgi:hypothetical protein